MSHTIEMLLLLLFVSVSLAIMARWLRLPDPILLVVAGLLLSLQPWAPGITLDPDIVFTLFLPPLLYIGAFNTKWWEFILYLRPISFLAVGLVIVTSASVAAVGYYFLKLPWAIGFVLGAIVSPPDAVAAMAILRRVKVPRRIVAILEGESLVNDAAALVTLRLAIAAVGAGTFSIFEATLEFVVVSAGGTIIGIAIGILMAHVHPLLDRNNLSDAKINITLTLLTPFAAYIIAEHLHTSGVLATVAAGLWIGTRRRKVFSEDHYDEAKHVWEWVEFFLNSLVFILIGFQLPQILEGLGDYTFTELATSAFSIVFVVILVRVAWVFPSAYVPRMLSSRIRESEPRPPMRGVLVVAWTGLRGVVSLAAALALKADFPKRNLIQFLTFCVIFATLVGQGLTLPWLVRFLKVNQDEHKPVT